LSLSAVLSILGVLLGAGSACGSSRGRGTSTFRSGQPPTAAGIVSIRPGLGEISAAPSPVGPLRFSLCLCASACGGRRRSPAVCGSACGNRVRLPPHRPEAHTALSDRIGLRV